MISSTPLPAFAKKFDVVSLCLEHEGKILILHRQDHKPQGNQWGLPAGKVETGENLLTALAREINEEIGLTIPTADCHQHASYFVRHHGYDLLYHVYHLRLTARPTIKLNLTEHKDYRWLPPKQVLALDLMADEAPCLKDLFNLK